MEHPIAGSAYDELVNKISVDDERWQQLIGRGIYHKYAPGEIIITQSQLRCGLVCVVSGRVRNCIFYPDGMQKTINYQDAPSLCNISAVLDGRTSLTTVQAVTDVTVSVLTEEDALRVLEEEPEIARMILMFYASRMRSVTFFSGYSLMRSRYKLALLLANASLYGLPTRDSGRTVFATHEMLADVLGVTRPKVTKYLNEMEQDGLIRCSRGKVRIPDHEKLIQFFMEYEG